MASLSCPDCGTVAEVVELDRHANSFCPTCDYPLFWAPQATVLLAGAARTSDAALRRLPGVAGHTGKPVLSCPSCAEPNPTASVTCWRCDALLRPPPEPEPEILEPVVLAPPAMPEPPQRIARRWPRCFWPVLAASLITVTVAMLVLTI
ncbi:MAG: hypothetical protein ACKV2O_23010 [Acidimicrobiales bacterium]